MTREQLSFRAVVVFNMKHKGIYYSVVQTANSRGWKWTVKFSGSQIRTGDTFSPESAVLLAKLTIEKRVAGKSQSRPKS